MTTLLGTSITLEELTEELNKNIKHYHINKLNVSLVLAHNFCDPRARTTIEIQTTGDKITFDGAQVTIRKNYTTPIIRFWLSDDKILHKLPEGWPRTFKTALQKQAPDLIKEHSLTLLVTPHNFISHLAWQRSEMTYPNGVKRLTRKMAIFGPMVGDRQITKTIKIIRDSIAAEASSVEEAFSIAKEHMLDQIRVVAKDKPLPEMTITNRIQDCDISGMANLLLLGTDLKTHNLCLDFRYEAPEISTSRKISANDMTYIERHYRYLEISEAQGGLMRVTGLAVWLLKKPDKTIRMWSRSFSKDILGRGVVKSSFKKGRLEASFKNDKIIVQTGKVTIRDAEKYPETIIASLKGRLLTDLIDLEGISPLITITSLRYQGLDLVVQVRDQSQYFIDGNKIIDHLNLGEQPCI